MTPPTDRPPSVDRLARSLADTGLPHPLLVDAARQAIAAGDPTSARALADEVAAALLRPVVNGTGVLLHTNLGRAPLGSCESGPGDQPRVRPRRRASGGAGRPTPARLLARAVGAEAAIVVNNCAAAVLLALAALARDRGVAVSRGELVEIGGGFRVPDVMAQSGARLVEVGTTNRTRLADYAAAVDDLAIVLKVHRSNYTISGFTEETSVADLASAGRARGRRPRLGLARRRLPVAGRRTAAVAARRTGGEADPGRGCRPRDLLGRQAARRAAGRDHRRVAPTSSGPARRTRSTAPSGPAGSCSAPSRTSRSPTSAGPPTSCRSGGWRPPRSRAPSPRRGRRGGRRRRGRRLLVGAGRRHPAVGRDPVHRRRARRRPHRRAPAPSPPVVARVVDDRTVIDLRTVDPDDDHVVAAALAGL